MGAQKYLKKGDQLSINELQNGRLEIIPSLSEEKEDIREINIDTKEKSIEDLQRDIISAYINGYNIINIFGDISGKIAGIREMFHELVALEIMEVTAKRVTAKVFSDVTGTSIDHLIRRINMITKTMIDETKALFETNRFFDDIVERDYEVNRQAFFGMRTLTIATLSPSVANKLNLSHFEIMYLRLLLEKLENIADRVKSLAKIFAKTELLIGLKKETRDELRSLLDMVGMNYDYVMKSLFKNDNKLTNAVFVTHTDNIKAAQAFLEKNKGVINLPLVVELLDRISALTENIARIVVDMKT